MVRFGPPKKSEQKLPKQEPVKKKEQPDRIDWLERKCKNLTLEHSHLKPLETLFPISSDLLNLDLSLFTLLKNTHNLLKNTDTQSKESRDFLYNLQIIDTSKETPLDKLESLNSNMQHAIKSIESCRLKQLIDMKEQELMFKEAVVDLLFNSHSSLKDTEYQFTSLTSDLREFWDSILPELELTAGENDILREDGGNWLLEELIKVVEESTSELTQYLDRKYKSIQVYMHQEVISLNNLMGEVRILMEPEMMKEMKRIEDVEERYEVISESVKDSLLNLLTYSTKNIESIEEAVSYLRSNVASLQYKAGCFVDIYEHIDIKQNTEVIAECKNEFEEVIHSCKDQLERLKRNHSQLETNSLNDLDNIEIKIEMLEQLHSQLRHKNGKVYSEQDIKDKIEITQSKLYEKVMNLGQDIFDIEIKLRNCVEALSKHGGLDLMIKGSEFVNEDNGMVINLRDAPPERKIQVGSGYIMQKEEDD